MNILITAKPGIGKTTAIKKIAESIGYGNVDGFFSEEIRVKGRRTGFRIKTFDGKEGVLAEISEATGPKVGKYTVCISDIENIAIPSLGKARKAGKTIIVDEIASMELKSEYFAIEVRKCLDTKRVIGTIQNRPSPFLNEVRNRTDVILINLTLNNRDTVPSDVVKRHLEF